MYDVFLICPVRNVNEIQKEAMNKYIENLENQGLSVYYPARDTNQNDDTGGYRICFDNRKAIENCKEVHIFWDKTSQGSLFDLGMAFMSGRKLIIVNKEDIEESSEKSFENVIKKWEKY